MKGARVAFCGDCGTGLQAGDAFCSNCGRGNPAAPGETGQVPAALPPPTPVSLVVPFQPAAAAPWGAAPVAPPQVFGGQPFPGQPSGPGQPPIAARPPLQIGRLSPEQTKSALTGAGYTLGGVLLLFTVMIGVLVGSIATSGYRGNPADWFRGSLLALAAAVHAPARLMISGDFGSSEDGSSVTGHVTLAGTATPLVLTLLLALVSRYVARRAELSHPSGSLRTLLTASAVTGVVFAVGAAILAAVAAGAPGFGSDTLLSDGSVTAKVSADPLLLLPGAFLVVTLGALLGRASTTGRAAGMRNGRVWLGQQLGAWRTDVRHALTLLAAVVVATLLAALGYGGYQLLHTVLTSGGSGSSDSSSSSGADGHVIAGGIVALVLSLPNVLLAAAGAAMGATAGGSGNQASGLLGSGRTGEGLLTGGVPLGLYLLMIPMLLAALIVGARLLYARESDQDRAGHTWRTVAVFGSMWLLLGLALQLSASEHGSAGALSQFSGDAGGSLTVGLGLPSLVAVALFWGVVSAGGGPLVGRFLAGATPRFATRLAGRHVSIEWRLLLADSVLTHGARMPASLTGAELALRQGERPQSAPLVIRPARDRAVIAGFLAVVVLAVGGGVGYVVISDTVYSPGSTVSSYMADLRAGDVHGALALVSKSSRNGLDRTLLTKAVLAQASVPSVKIVKTDQSGDSATVTVTENGATTSLDLVREGRAYGVLPTWRLRQPFTMLQISGSAAGVTVNGVGTYSSSVPVFPGTYTVSTVPSGIYDSASSTVTADGTGSQDVGLNPSLSADAGTAATDAVKAFLDNCALSTDLAPSGCPFSYTDYSNAVTSVTWSIATYPDVNVADSSGTLAVTDVSNSGVAHLEAVTSNYDGSSSPLSQDVSFTISGTLDWAGGDPTSATFTSS